MWLATVRKTMKERALVRPGAPVVLALSGGPDSAGMALALSTLAPELGITLHAVSIDHGLRPGSEADVELARAHAASIGAPFVARRLQLSPGPDVSARARNARYEVLFEVARDIHAEHVAVGHTQDDQAETVIARVLRGASVRGLRGIAPARADGVIRPLFDCRRADVHAAVRARGWAVAEDPSNQNEAFQRARLRAHVMPALRAEAAELVPHLAELADDAAQLMELVEAMAEGVRSAAELEPGVLRSEPLRRAPIACRREALAAAAAGVTGRRPSRAQLLELERALRGHGEVPLGAGFWGRAEPGRLTIERRAAAEQLGPSEHPALDLPARSGGSGEEG